MEYVFIVNPAAGSGFAAEMMGKLEPVLKEKEVPYRVLRTERPAHATELARQCAGDSGVKAVVAVGGDGTVGEVAAGLCGTEMPMGIIPAGTGNDLIKSAGIPKDPAAALDFLLTHEARAVDTGRVNDGMFLNVCGTGFDVTVLDQTERFKARFKGLMPYLLGLIQAIFRYRPVRLKVTADGEKLDGEYLVCSIANGRFIGGGIPICPVAEIEDGKLNLVLIRDVPRWKIPFYLPGLMGAKDLTFRITRHQLVSEVILEGENMRINVDGEILPMGRAEFSIRPGSLMLIC